ncbi:DNA-binding transcriptional regulator, MerR family [Quadrisphaera granulorum]|uniref:DNA-binding transcriptional MerR regulator n=1 Tax=Quadrisphaera granulorum TaxID=317664 RepID=A0A315ZQM6_9ACTN|nr:MerR family transcriptional regulator [Quadrisphaera granulorum]PWJ47582.1 DNA-binding transcriptional MerR regulator [Quadrisphaera granulorum]SZE98712.1 DNA-binding transcriptional regulator, MerR family [Quadrisphaera granulorum]
MDGRLTVGQIADAAGMTARAMRHYDRIGLFVPDEVDEDTGYRWYAADRLPQARLVGALRAVGVPLDGIATCLSAAGDPDVVDDVLADHRRRLESRLARVRGDLHRLAHLIEDLGCGHDELGGGAGTSLAPELPAPVPTLEAPTRTPDRQLAVDLFNGVWRLMETEDRTPAQDDRMIHAAHASRYHWEQAGTAVNLARGEWQCSRVYAVLGRAEPALHHARRVLEICQENGIGDWDLAFAHEALARASAVANDDDAVRRHLADAQAAAEHIADPEDRALLESDLASISSPGAR